MKVRWTRGSIRFRITPTEMIALERGAEIAEALELPGGGGWRAAIRPGGSDQTAIRQEGGTIRLLLSDADRACLSAPGAEGVYFRSEGATPLRYYVEKDFPCAHPGAPEAQEPAAETFAPPPDFKARHTACE